MYNLIKNKIPRHLIHSLKDRDFFVSFLQTLYRVSFDAPVVNMHINSECNYGCTYCYSKKKASRKTDWMRVLDDCNKLNVREVQFLGGEPLLDKDIRRYLKKCEEFGMNVILFTNGILINKRFITFIKNLKIEVRLAIKFDTPECHERDISGNTQDYKKLIKIIRNCTDNGINVLGHVTVSKHNFQMIPDLINTANKLNIILTFERYIPVHRCIGLELNSEEWCMALKTISDFYTSKDKYYLAHSVIRGNTCNCCMDLLSIDVDGYVKPCPFSAIEESLGNVNTQTLPEIWRLFQEKREEWLKIPDDCRECKSKLICHGGCRTYTFIHKKKYNAKDPLCNGEIIPTLGWCGFGVKNHE